MCAERVMGSREEQTTTHQPLLSSLVVRPTDSGGVGGGGGGGSDYEPGEVRRDHPPYSRSDRNNGHGYRMGAGSVSPVRRRDTHHRLSPGFERSSGASRSHGFGKGRESGRFREHSPLYGRGKADSRFSGRGYNHSPRGLEPLRVEGFPRNNPNVQPREGDWICSDPSCKNLNFARRDHCNNCNRPRYASTGNPRRGYLGPSFPPGQHVPVAPLDHSPGRILHGGYRSPPRGWPRDAPRDFRPTVPPRRRGGRFPDPVTRNDRLDYPEDEIRDRYRHDRPMMPEWGNHRDNYFNERRGYGRRMVSPPPEPPVPRVWGSHIRIRSRSPPVRGVIQPKNYQRDTYMNRMRDDRRVIARDAF